MDIGQVSVWTTLFGHGHLDIGQVSQLPVCGQPSLDADIWTFVFYVRCLCLKPSPDTDIRTLNPGKDAKNLLPGAYRVPGNILAPISKAWEPESGKKCFCLFRS